MLDMQRERLAEVERLADELQRAFSADEWSEVERLLAQRNRAAEAALTADLVEELHERARELFERLQQQDAELKSQAQRLQQQSRGELQKMQKNRQAIKAYQKLE